MKRKLADEAASLPSKLQKTNALALQIITGSYERVLHGFVAHIASDEVTFSDTFLFPAHTSSIRSLAVSPPNEAGKRTLATGSADERVNLYQLSSSPNPLATSIAEDPRNKELGSLLHHSRTVTRLHFPTKTKLFSAADDNTVAITRVRDWTMLSSVKAPIPVPHGRPTGDTAAPGEVPAGVNDFAIHPSMKLMLTVSKGERAMRLWNLVTGKKAGVLTFDRALLRQAGEGKHATGEGRRIVWDPAGEHFVVVFERGAVVYDMDSEPVAVVRAAPDAKLHQARFLPGRDGVLVLSTEGGRLLFFDLAKVEPPAEEGLPLCRCVTQIESPTLNSAGRVKDFDIYPVAGRDEDLVVVTASSDGTVRLWGIRSDAFDGEMPANVGTLLAVKETGNRITCLTGFVMDGAREDVTAPAGDAP